MAFFFAVLMAIAAFAHGLSSDDTMGGVRSQTPPIGVADTMGGVR